MSDIIQDPDSVCLSLLQQSATQRVIEFLIDSEMKQTRTRLQQGWYGPVLGPSCRRAVLEQIGTLGEPGLRMGLLVFALETLMSLVRWDQVAKAVAWQRPPSGAIGNAQALDRVEFS